MQRITEFEGLRAILSWWIVWGHLLQYSGLATKDSLPLILGWLLNGGSAVNVFIILSGFVIFLLLDSGRSKNYRQFITERFFRIYPLFITAFIMAVILMPVKLFVFQNGTWHNIEFAEKMLRQGQNSYRYLIPHLFAHSTLLQGVIPDQLLPDSSVAFLAPAWSLSLEWQFYLVAPLLILGVRRYLVASLLGALVIIGFGQLLSTKLTFGYGAFLPIKFDFFVVGIVSYYAYKFSVKEPATTRNVFPFLSLAFILGALIFLFVPYQPLALKAVPLLIWSITLSVILARSIKFNFLPLQLLGNFLNHPLLQSLGRVSYSTYLTHILVLWVLMWAALKIYPDIDRNTVLIVLGSLGTISVVAASFACYYWIEKPFMDIGKRVSKKLAAKPLPG